MRSFLALVKALAFLITICAGMAGIARAQTAPAEPPAEPIEFYARIKVAGFATPVELRQSGLKTRVDVTAGGVLQSYITDREKGILISMTATGQNRIALVFPLDRAEAIIPLPLELAVLTEQATVRGLGAAMVGGKSCRLMEFTGYLNQSGIICVSPDKVILQMTRKGHRDPLFEVIELAVGRQDPRWFRTPPDYQVAVLPAIGGAAGEGAIGVPPASPPTQ